MPFFICPNPKKICKHPNAIMQHKMCSKGDNIDGTTRPSSHSFFRPNSIPMFDEMPRPLSRHGATFTSTLMDGPMVNQDQDVDVTIQKLGHYW